MLKPALLAALPLVLSACAIPAAVVVTAAADGAIYMNSGKSVSSHALSEAAEQDCSVLYGITRGKFCRDTAADEIYAKKGVGFVIPKDEPAARAPAAQSASGGDPAAPQVVLEPRFLDLDDQKPSDPAATAAQSW